MTRDELGAGLAEVLGTVAGIDPADIAPEKSLAEDNRDDLATTFARYQQMCRARTRAIQRSSWVTSTLLHLPEGPALQRRNAKVARFPEDFGWIHEYDVQQELERIGVTAMKPEPAYQR